MSIAVDSVPKKPRAQVRKACATCKKDHLSCADQRPCPRCVQRGIADTCKDAKHHKRGRPSKPGKNGSMRKSGSSSSPNSSGSSSPRLPPVSVTSSAAPQTTAPPVLPPAIEECMVRLDAEREKFLQLKKQQIDAEIKQLEDDLAVQKRRRKRLDTLSPSDFLREIARCRHPQTKGARADSKGERSGGNGGEATAVFLVDKPNHTTTTSAADDDAKVGDKRKRNTWTPEEDKRLIHLRTSGLSWKEIGTRIPGRTWKACDCRYKRLKALNRSEEQPEEPRVRDEVCTPVQDNPNVPRNDTQESISPPETLCVENSSQDDANREPPRKKLRVHEPVNEQANDRGSVVGESPPTKEQQQEMDAFAKRARTFCNDPKYNELRAMIWSANDDSLHRNRQVHQLWNNGGLTVTEGGRRFLKRPMFRVKKAVKGVNAVMPCIANQHVFRTPDTPTFAIVTRADGIRLRKEMIKVFAKDNTA